MYYLETHNGLDYARREIFEEFCDAQLAIRDIVDFAEYDSETILQYEDRNSCGIKRAGIDITIKIAELPA